MGQFLVWNFIEFVNKIYLSKREDTDRFGLALAGSLSESESASVLITLSGDLGAGKTTLVQAVARALEVEEVVSSPTFTTMNEYHSGWIPLYHLDLYRASETEEMRESLSFFVLEFEEILEDGALVMIEWPEFFLVDGESYLNDIDRLEIKLERNDVEGEQARILNLEARGGTASALLNRLLACIEPSESIRIA